MLLEELSGHDGRNRVLSVSLAMSDCAWETKLSNIEEAILFNLTLSHDIAVLAIVRRQVHEAQVD